MEGLDLLFRDVFACLSVSAFLQHGFETFPLRLLVRQPEGWIPAGEAEFLSSRFQGEIQIAEVPAIAVGDTIVIGERRYKIFQEPLKDPSGTVWQVHGMIVEGAL